MSTASTPEPLDTDTPVSQPMRDAIAKTITEVRRVKGWSIRELARRSGLSKALISRLERGQANPSLETLWLIVGALGIPFTELIHTTTPEPHLVRSDDRTPFETQDHNMRIELIMGTADGVEIYELQMPPNATSQWDSHGLGTHEYAFVLSGDIWVDVDGKTYEMLEGDLLAFQAHHEHQYRSGNIPARVLCLMRYEGSDQNFRASQRAGS